MLLVSVVHSDLEDGGPLVAEQGDRLGVLVQLVDAAPAVLVPEQELFVMTESKGVVQLLALVHHLGQSQHSKVCVSLSI